MADDKNDPRFDSRTGDEAPPKEAWAKIPQQVDGGELNPDAVEAVPQRRKRKPEPNEPAAENLDSRDGDALPPEEAFKPVPQNVDGGVLGDEGVKPRG